MTARLVVPVATLSLLAVAGLGAKPADGPFDRTYLAEVVGLSDSKIKQLGAGTPLTTTLSGRAGQEVVTFGVVRIRKPADEVVRSLRSIAVSPLGLDDPRVRLHQPAQPGDWSTLTLAPAALSNLPTCRAGHCAVQLPEAAIARLQAEPTDAVARRVIHDIVTAYQRSGHRALQPYADRRPATSPSDEYKRLLASPEYLPLPLERVREYLDQYPHVSLPGVNSDFYWSVQDFGMKPTLRVFHRVVADESAVADPGGHVAGAMATLQVLATHYFSSSLELHIVVRDPADSGAAFVYHLTRSWTPGLSGLRGAMARSSAKRNGREAVAQYLEHARRIVEGERRGYDPFWETQP